MSSEFRVPPLRSSTASVTQLMRRKQRINEPFVLANSEMCVIVPGGRSQVELVEIHLDPFSGRGDDDPNAFGVQGWNAGMVRTAHVDLR